MKNNKIIIFLVCIFISLLWFGILTHITNKTTIEETNSFKETLDNIVKCDVSIMTADAVTLECTVQYFHNESRPGMIIPTVDVINSCLRLETRLLTREYSLIDFINNKEEIINKIRAIPQQSKTMISSDFSWEILNVTIKL